MCIDDSLLIELAPGISLVRGENNARFPYAHSLLVEGDTCSLVDAGLGQKRLEALGDRVDMVVNTHYHIDHILGNSLLPHAQIWAPEGEEGAIESSAVYLEQSGMHRLGDLAAEWLTQLGYPACKVYGTFGAGSVFDLGGVRVEVVSLPGHSRNHCGFWCPDQGILFSGDVDLTSFGPWYGFDDGNPEGFFISLDRILALEPRLVVTSHRDPVSADELPEVVAAYRQVVYDRDERIAALLAQSPATLEEIANRWLIYGKPLEPREFFYFWEKGMVSKHLQRLERQERIVGEDGRYHLR